MALQLVQDFCNMPCEKALQAVCVSFMVGIMKDMHVWENVCHCDVTRARDLPSSKKLGLRVVSVWFPLIHDIVVVHTVHHYTTLLSTTASVCKLV